MRLPRTTTRRGAVAYCTLVERVNLDPRVLGFFAWEGQRYKPGAEVAGIPSSPLCLEVTEAPGAELQRGRRRWEQLYILWLWESNSWREIARLLAPCSYDQMELRKFAARTLEQDAWREFETVRDSAERIHSYLDSEIRQLGSQRRAPVLEIVLQQIVGRLVDSGTPSGCIPSLPDRFSVRV